MAAGYFNFNQLKTPTVKVQQPKKVSVAQGMGPQVVPNVSSALAGVGKPMAIKKINVRNTGFKIH